MLWGSRNEFSIFIEFTLRLTFHATRAALVGLRHYIIPLSLPFLLPSPFFFLLPSSFILHSPLYNKQRNMFILNIWTMFWHKDLSSSYIFHYPIPSDNLIDSPGEGEKALPQYRGCFEHTFLQFQSSMAPYSYQYPTLCSRTIGSLQYRTDIKSAHWGSRQIILRSRRNSNTTEFIYISLAKSENFRPEFAFWWDSQKKRTEWIATTPKSILRRCSILETYRHWPSLGAHAAQRHQSL